MPNVKNWRKSCWVLTTLVLFGCGQSKPTITGSVTYNGEPLGYGYISFQSVDGKSRSFAARITNGQYSAVDRVTPGVRRVVIMGSNTTGPITREESARRAEAGINEAADYIAEDAEGNSKEVEIQPGDQTLDFAITGTPVPK